jgi:glycosyltransferase involved in cell wall biosynthesis
MATVLMVSGSWPPAACAVADYADLLCRHLEAAGVDVARYSHPHFSRPYSPAILNDIAASNCDIIHIQYPTAGYGRSFVPSAVPRRVRGKPVVVTLHEYALFRFYRKPWFAPFARYCATRVFVNPSDRALFQARFPKRNGFDTTIELASEIPVGAAADRTESKVIYLGPIAPHRGIEEYLEFCAIARTRSRNITAELIGAIPATHRRFAERVFSKARATGVDVACDLSHDEVASHLSQATFAYLPFPDGASTKRSSIAAAMLNGLAVITRHSALTPDWLRSVTVGVATPDEACQAIMRLGRDVLARRNLVQRAALTAKRFRWESITARHVELYGRLLGLSDEMPAAQASA